MDEVANSFFNGSLLTELRNIDFHYMYTGKFFSITLVSARFDVGNANLDQDGNVLNSWQSPPRLTSTDVDINGTVSTFSMVNTG
ncbi:MAG TPA: hypothetical protein VKK79_06355 [Candidatus Lokiarchaeia archaeon]|nr:hypothetical protein [Candidatus Lokiarchaeia archaeon]